MYNIINAHMKILYSTCLLNKLLRAKYLELFHTCEYLMVRCTKENKFHKMIFIHCC